MIFFPSLSGWHWYLRIIAFGPVHRLWARGENAKRTSKSLCEGAKKHHRGGSVRVGLVYFDGSSLAILPRFAAEIRAGVWWVGSVVFDQAIIIVGPPWSPQLLWATALAGGASMLG